MADEYTPGAISKGYVIRDPEPAFAAVDPQRRLAQEIERLQAQVEYLQARFKRVTEFGEDDFPVNAILVFDKSFDEDQLRRHPGKTYSYAAIKAENEMWYLTGQNNSRMSWPQLVHYMTDGVEEVFYVTAMERVF